jgi:hypothetical protein
VGVLRKLAGPNQGELWRQLSAEIDARYVGDGLGRGDKVEVTHGEWTVTLDSYSVSSGHVNTVYTRMRAPYVNPDGFRFTIYRRGLFSDIAKWLGMQDVEVGYKDFDRDFIIKGTSTTRLRELFASQRLRELIALQPEIHFTVKDDQGWFGPKFSPKADVLVFHCVGVIKDIPRLKGLYELFGETLDQLCRLGSAYEDAPDVER